MCGQMDFDLSPLSLRHLHGVKSEFDQFGRELFVTISGRRWGKSRNSDLNVRWLFELPPDDRPISKVVDEHFRARFERSERVDDDFQALYDVSGALQR